MDFLIALGLVVAVLLVAEFVRWLWCRFGETDEQWLRRQSLKVRHDPRFPEEAQRLLPHGQMYHDPRFLRIVRRLDLEASRQVAQSDP